MAASRARISLTRSASWCLRCHFPPGASFLFGAVFGDPASISFGERAPENSDFKIPAVGRRSGLLSPGVVQVTTVDRVEAEVVDQAKHWGLRLYRSEERRVGKECRSRWSP